MSVTTKNLLWELKCKEQDDCYHNGADISYLSQYPHEEEVLFPPLTMLYVCGPYEEVKATTVEDETRVYTQIEVVPYHV